MKQAVLLYVKFKIHIDYLEEVFIQCYSSFHYPKPQMDHLNCLKVNKNPTNESLPWSSGSKVINSARSETTLNEIIIFDANKYIYAIRMNKMEICINIKGNNLIDLTKLSSLFCSKSRFIVGKWKNFQIFSAHKFFISPITMYPLIL